MLNQPKIKISESWKSLLKDEFSSQYMQDLKSFLKSEKEKGKIIFPKEIEYFKALELTPPENVNLVILGQDPYHGEGQAHGLSFSVKKGVKIPPSLSNIYKELETDIGIKRPNHGCLEDWAKQGVLMLNSSLSVEAGNAGSHQGKGWEIFTDAIISKVNDLEQPIVFLLWGAFAIKKASFLSHDKHLILTAPHPSPLSAYRGFFGCKHFSQANDFLIKNGKNPINWQV